MSLTLLSEPQTPKDAMLTVPSSVFVRYSPHASAQLMGLRDLIQKLPPLSRLLLACHRRCTNEIRSWLPRSASQTTIVPIDDNVDFSLWSQDISLCVHKRSSGDLVLLGSAQPIRRADEMAVAEVAAAAGIVFRRAAFRFEAGNVVAGESFVLVGEDIRRSTETRLHGSSNLISDTDGMALADVAGERAVVFVGTSRPVPVRSVRLRKADADWYVEEIFAGSGGMQPVFHLDMFVSLAGSGADGRFRILVGDSRMAAEMIDGHRTSLAPHFLADELDEVADQLRSYTEFNVSRNPLPLICGEETGLLRWSRASIEREFGAVSGGEEVIHEMERHNIRQVAVRRWYFATQNNVVTYRGRDSRRNVLIPTYAYGKWRGLAASELRNEAIWTELGYRVTPLANFNAFARAHGSARCLVKLLP